MDCRVYRITMLHGAWVAEQDNLIIRASSQDSAIELATSAAKHDVRLGHSAQVLLDGGLGRWATIWSSDDDGEGLKGLRELPPAIVN